MKNIPNILSIIRICLVFVFVAIFFSPISKIWALVAFLSAGATDVVDGFLARKNNWITDLGKVLDPFADKLMQCTVLVCLCIESVVPIWFLIIFFAKDSVYNLTYSVSEKEKCGCHSGLCFGNSVKIYNLRDVCRIVHFSEVRYGI